MSSPRPRAARLSGDAGFSLIEVMASALVLIIVATGILVGLEGSSKASGQSRMRNLAANLAQNDQERLRIFRGSELSNLDSGWVSKPTKVGGNDTVNFEVRSTGDFVSETNQSAGCTATAKADLVKIVSTVRWPGARRPVRIESLLAPPVGSFGPNQGSAVLKLTNAAGGPVQGANATISPGVINPATRATNAEGCALFAYITAGSYQISYDEQGWVDPEGNQAVTVPASVLGQQITTYQKSYDRAASVEVKAYTVRDGEGPTVTQNSSWASLSMRHSGMGSAGLRLITPTAQTTELHAFSANRLYPFATPYGVHTGDCTANAMAVAPPAGYVRDVTLAPGATNVPVKVFQPGLDVQVNFRPVVNSGTYTRLSGARVYFRSATASCAQTLYGPRTTGADGRLSDVGVPYGSWNVCVDIPVPNGGGVRRKAEQTNILNNDLADKNVVFNFEGTGQPDSRCAP